MKKSMNDVFILYSLAFASTFLIYFLPFDTRILGTIQLVLFAIVYIYTDNIYGDVKRYRGIEKEEENNKSKALVIFTCFAFIALVILIMIRVRCW